MRVMETQPLLSVPEIARRLGISNEEAFDLAFVTRELPLKFSGNDHGVPEAAVEAYRRAHSQP